MRGRRKKQTNKTHDRLFLLALLLTLLSPIHLLMHPSILSLSPSHPLFLPPFSLSSPVCSTLSPSPPPSGCLSVGALLIAVAGYLECTGSRGISKQFHVLRAWISPRGQRAIRRLFILFILVSRLSYRSSLRGYPRVPPLLPPSGRSSPLRTYRDG